MRVRNVGKRYEKVELMMTPMIDVVFQLLIFFMFTFKIVAPEGNFNIKMPVAAVSQAITDERQLPTLKIRLRAAADGQLAGISLGQRSVKSFEDLRREIRAIVGDEAGPGSVAGDQEVELDCDYNLRFEYVVDAITAVTGYVSEGRIVKLIEKIRFAPPRAG